MPWGKQSLRSMADVVGSLFVEYESTLEKTTVVRVVRGCQQEMAISGSTSPDLLHSRARRRLQALVTLKQRRPSPADQSTTDDSNRPTTDPA
ncbi:MAG: hypothetical protein ACR2P2_21945 [Nakamurella sp.]